MHLKKHKYKKISIVLLSFSFIMLFSGIVLLLNQNRRENIYKKVNLTVINSDSNEKIGNSIFGLYKDQECKNVVALGTKFKELEPNHTYYLKEIKPPTNFILYKDILEVKVNSRGKIEIKKLVNSDTNIQYRDTNSKKPLISQKANLAVITVPRSAIITFPNIQNRQSLYFRVFGLVIMISSVYFYVYYIKRKEGKLYEKCD